MCVQCNSARAQILQLMGHPPWNKIYPSKFGFVKQILMWCLITIEDGNDAGKQIPNIHNEFMQIRTGGEDFPNKPTRAFGVASTWSIGDEPNYLHNHSTTTHKRSNKPTRKSLTLSFFDWMFAYKSKEQQPPEEKPSTNSEVTTPQEKASKTPKLHPADRAGKRMPETTNKNAFIDAITKLVSRGEEISVMAIGNRIRKMQETTGWEEVGTRSFLQHYGFPRNFGLLKALESSFGARMTVHGDKSEQRIRIIQESEVNPQPDVEALRDVILKLISDEDMGKFQLQTSFLGKIGIRIRKMQNAEGWEHVGTRVFLKKYGFKSNFGLLNALKICFGNQLEVVGNHPDQQIRIKINSDE